MATTRQRTTLERRVADAAEAALAHKDHVAPVDVLVGIGWLARSHVDLWVQGRVPYLERLAQVDVAMIAKAVRILQAWAAERGLTPNEASYLARTRDRRSLRLTEMNVPTLERDFRTHWISPDLSDRERRQVVERASRPPDVVVVMPLKDWACAKCSGTGRFLIMDEPGPLCMTCADMDHLVFLPSDNAALTRRARKASGLSAVVVRFSRTRKRYERQGVLVEEEALAEAEAQCLADEEVRTRRRARDEERRAAEDVELRERLSTEIRRLYPGCDRERADAIARHAAVRGSGRVGRTAAARDLDPGAIEAAVAASVRHLDTSYDEMLMSGVDRQVARGEVRGEVARIMEEWHRSPAD